MSVGDLLHSKRWKLFMNYVYNIAGALVIIGALFKLMHWPMAGTFLTIGMCTEALIFLISSLEPLHEQPTWSKVFPQLSEDYIPGDDVPAVMPAMGGGGVSSVGSVGAVNVDMGGIFDKANIAPEILDKVSKGLTDLGNTASSISDISSATLATNVYVDNLNTAAESMATLAKVSEDANGGIAESVEKLSGACQAISEVVSKEVTQVEGKTNDYREKMTALCSNIEQLNSTYANQLSALQAQFENSQKFNAQMAEMTTAVTNSVEEMKKYQTVSTELNKNLEALNSIYGNMLGAMNYKK